MTAIPIPVIASAADIAAVQAALKNPGAALVRGEHFDLGAFEAFTRHFCDRFHISATRYQLRQGKGDNFSTEVYRNNYTLFAHSEGTYKPYPGSPEACFFMCVTPPSARGGETTLFDGVEFYKRLPAPIRERFEKSGVTYEMYWEKERWQHEFEMEDVPVLEALLKTLPAVRYSFHGEDVHLYYTTQAITRDLRGHNVFAPALLAHLPRITHPHYQDKAAYCKPSNRVHFGDGEEIPDSVINQLIDIHDAIMYPHAWQAGDIVVLDNTRWMHGRTMTERDCERVLVSRFGWFKNGLKG